MRKHNWLFLVGLVPCLVGCRPPSSDTEAATDRPSAVAPADGPALQETSPVSSMLWFEPAGLSACGPGTDVVAVNWDVSATPGVTAVKISLVNEEGGETLFAATGPTGSKDTGPWAHAGTAMILRDAATGGELAQATVAGIPCEMPGAG